MTCVHHWLIASPSGPGVAMPASCKHCRAEREFEHVEPVPMEVYRTYQLKAHESIPVEYGWRA